MEPGLQGLECMTNVKLWRVTQWDSVSTQDQKFPGSNPTSILDQAL